MKHSDDEPQILMSSQGLLRQGYLELREGWGLSPAV